jgi:hypothetical protein
MWGWLLVVRRRRLSNLARLMPIKKMLIEERNTRAARTRSTQTSQRSRSLDILVWTQGRDRGSEHCFDEGLTLLKHKPRLPIRWSPSRGLDLHPIAGRPRAIGRWLALRNDASTASGSLAPLSNPLHHVQAARTLERATNSVSFSRRSMRATQGAKIRPALASGNDRLGVDRCGPAANTCQRLGQE